MGEKYIPVNISPRFLPFSELDEYTFEGLCTDLFLDKQNYKDVNHFGRRGQSQYGIDILGYNVELDGFCGIQCKQYDEFTTNLIDRTCSKFLKDFKKTDYWDRTKEFIICISGVMGDDTDRIKNFHQHREEFNKLGLEFSILDGQKLSNELKKKSSIVYTYFGDQWVSNFCNIQRVNNIDVNFTDLNIVSSIEFLSSKLNFQPSEKKGNFPKIITVSETIDFLEFNSVFPKTKFLGALYNQKCAIKDYKVCGLNIHDFKIRIPPNKINIASLEDLEYLILKNCELEAFHFNISQLKKLKHIDLSKNHFKKIPDNFENLKLVTNLNLSNNKIDDIGGKLNSFCFLKYLNIENNPLNSLNIEFEKLIHLEIIYFNSKIQKIPPYITILPKLRMLSFNFEKITEIPIELLKIEKLEKLVIYNLVLNTDKKMKRSIRRILRKIKRTGVVIKHIKIDNLPISDNIITL